MKNTPTEHISEALKRDLGAVKASDEFGFRTWEAARAVDFELVGQSQRRRARPVWRRSLVVAAASAMAVAAVVVVISIAPWSSTAPTPASGPIVTHLSASSAAADPLQACAHPNGTFARFWYITSGDDSAQYEGTVRIGAATVPALSMFVSGGAPGIGTLCVSNRAGFSPAIQSSARVRAGKVGYVGDVHSVLYFAVGPGVQKVTVDFGAGSTKTYSLDGTGELQLQPLGDQWHAVSTGYGTSPGSIVVRAYEAGGQLVDTVDYTIKPDSLTASSASSSK